MNFGNISGLVNGTEQVVFDHEVTGSAVSSIPTGNILNGDEDGWYTIIYRHIGVSTVGLGLLFNGDSGTNYGRRGIRFGDTTVADTNATGETLGYITFNPTPSGQTAFSVIRLYAKSGSVRLFNVVGFDAISGTTVSDGLVGGGIWNNTADNLVSITVTPDSGSNNIGVGSRMIVLKSNNFTNGTPTGVINTPYIQGSWVEVGTRTLAAKSTSFDFTGLNGDRDVLYLLSCQVKSDSGNMGETGLRFNNDTGSNYGYQEVYAQNTGITAARYTARTNINAACNAWTTGYGGMANILIFAKSGFNRCTLGSSVQDINGTAIEYLNMDGGTWQNTADVINQITLYTGTDKIAAGSVCRLMALRPNG